MESKEMLQKKYYELKEKHIKKKQEGASKDELNSIVQEIKAVTKKYNDLILSERLVGDSENKSEKLFLIREYFDIVDEYNNAVNNNYSENEINGLIMRAKQIVQRLNDYEIRIDKASIKRHHIKEINKKYKKDVISNIASIGASAITTILPLVCYLVYKEPIFAAAMVPGATLTSGMSYILSKTLKEKQKEIKEYRLEETEVIERGM